MQSPLHLPIRILAADDEESILVLYRRVLLGGVDENGGMPDVHEMGEAPTGRRQPPGSSQPAFELTLCHNTPEALEQIRLSLERKSPYAVVFLDVRMSPGPDGVYAAQEIRKMDPDVQIVLVTAYSDVNLSEVAARIPPLDKLLYVQKPFHPRELRHLALALASKWQAERAARTTREELEALVLGRTAELLEKNRQLEKEIAERARVQESLVDSQKHLARSRKMEALGQLASGVAHDFNDLLQVILGYNQMAISYLPRDHESAELLNETRKTVEQAATLTRLLLAFSRSQFLQARDIRLNLALPDLLKTARTAMGDKVRLEIHAAENVRPIHADPDQLALVLGNLCENSVQAMPEGGTIRIDVRDADIPRNLHHELVPVGRDKGVLLRVEDTGCGMDKHILDHVFEPFFTTWDKSGGTGLGLSAVYGIVKQHGGAINVTSLPGKGTVFEIYFPASEGAATPSPATRLPANTRGGAETILLAEDDKIIIEMAKSILERAGYTVLTAMDGEEALEVFHAHKDEIALIILDVVMPKIGGQDASEKIHALRGGIPILFTSGYSASALDLLSAPEGCVRFLAKPYNLEDLLTAVRELLDKAAQD